MTQNYTSRDIYKQLYSEIMSLQRKPGAVLRENALCEEFGVSRTPIRSVLQELRIAGLIEVTPYKSTHVTRLDFDTISQQIYLRVAVETAVLRRLVAQPDPVPEAFYHLDSCLHEYWFTATGKDQLWKLIQTNQNSYSRFRMLDLVEARNFEEIVREHDDLLQAIADKDADRVRAVCSKHLYGGVTRLGQELPTQFADYFVPGTRWPDPARKKDTASQS